MFLPVIYFWYPHSKFCTQVSFDDSVNFGISWSFSIHSRWYFRCFILKTINYFSSKIYFSQCHVLLGCFLNLHYIYVSGKDTQPTLDIENIKSVWCDMTLLSMSENLFLKNNWDKRKIVVNELDVSECLRKMLIKNLVRMILRKIGPISDTTWTYL